MHFRPVKNFASEQFEEEWIEQRWTTKNIAMEKYSPINSDNGKRI